MVISIIVTFLSVGNFSSGFLYVIIFLLVGGGIIPKKDIDSLEGKGVGKLFGPGTPVQDTVDFILNWVQDNRR